MWELICGDKNWLEEYIESMCFYRQQELILESVKWDYVTPWQATYWKRLNGGHRVRCRCRDKSEEGNSKPPLPPFAEYFHRVWYAWR